jgi:hypothetical protein
MKRFLISIFLSALIYSANCQGNALKEIVLPGNVSVQLPKNWLFVSDDQIITIDAAVQSLLDLNQLPYLPFNTEITAVYFDDQGDSVSSFSIKYYREKLISQKTAAKVGDEFISALDGGLRQGVERSARALKLNTPEWKGTAKQVLSGRTFFVTEFIRGGLENNHQFVTRLVRYLDTNLNFTITVTYDNSHSMTYLLKPITDLIIQSIKVH